ncbi:protein CURVATURE THYLAKOID 1C, chloroplastic-like isoform X2 [Phragmites australis]|nr:protein CURVATURE THYLAKOID 1C, chloroplastic-like isoform X2 [Phragmites australis]
MMAGALAVAQPAAALLPCGGTNLSGRLPRLPSPRFSGDSSLSRSLCSAASAYFPPGFSVYRHGVVFTRMMCPAMRGAGRSIRSRSVVAKVAQDSSESSGSIVKYVNNSFSAPEDIIALVGIGFAAIAALWASVNLVEAIDKLPVLPLLFELIGILVAWLFIYNNLFFKSDR